jgi:hypothetical protein
MMFTSYDSTTPPKELPQLSFITGIPKEPAAVLTGQFPFRVEGNCPNAMTLVILKESYYGFC